MNTTIREERLLVVSDVHLGNRLFRARRPFIDFLNYARTYNYNLCINGDGVDIVQTTMMQITRDLSECTGAIRKFSQDGLKVYYTIGNHDIVLEHFLDDWEIIRLAPFLNLYSGNKRIRIEHGHLYDDQFVNHPRLYTAATRLGGLALRIHPSAYHLLEKSRTGVERLQRRFRSRRASDEAVKDELEAIPDEPRMFRERALEISRHGFDAVIFGHTHCWGQIRLNSESIYINTGSWLFEPHFAEIDSGKVTLKRVADCLASPRTEPRDLPPARASV